MNVPIWIWLVTVAALLGLLAVDLFIVDRNPHRVRMAEAARWVGFYVVAALGFGVGVWAVAGPRYAGEFFAGYLTEYSLSVDNLFVFVLIMSAFAVPAVHQHRVLLFGILAALALRGLFIAVGATVIAHFQGIFYLFGAFLVYTGWRLAFASPGKQGKGGSEKDYRDNLLLRVVRRALPVTDRYHGTKMVVRIAGRRHLTPMLVVMLAIGSTDLLFALDSIPAIFGLTREPFLVFAANAFALMGLRQLFFLIGGLLDRLVYLSVGLAVILVFIGAKLISEALHGSGVGWAPHVGIELSLGVIGLVLAVTTAASLIKVRRDPTAIHRTAGAPPVAVPAAVPTAGGTGVGDQVADRDDPR